MKTINPRPELNLGEEGETLSTEAEALLTEILPDLEIIRAALLDPMIGNDFTDDQRAFLESGKLEHLTPGTLEGFRYPLVDLDYNKKESIPASLITRLLSHADRKHIFGDYTKEYEQSSIVGKQDLIKMVFSGREGEVLKSLCVTFPGKPYVLNITLYCEEGWKNVKSPDGDFINATIRRPGNDDPEPAVVIRDVSFITTRPLP